jgi:hypothetical protein
VIARRQPEPDQILWTVALPDHLDADDPSVRADIADAIRKLRVDTGL